MPGPWSFEEFCRWLSRRRGKPIELRPLNADLLDGAPCGWSVDCEDVDIIYYAVSTAKLHSRFISYHECAHLLFGHEGTPSDCQAFVQLAPDIAPDAIRNALGRTDYDEPQEQEAELLAMSLLRHDEDRLLTRRGRTDPEDLAYYLCHCPARTTLNHCHRRRKTRAIEETFYTAKGQTGLDHYQVRQYAGWCRRLTLSMLAHTFLTVTRSKKGAREPGDDSELIALSVPEIRRVALPPGLEVSTRPPPRPRTLPLAPPPSTPSPTMPLPSPRAPA
ncbi:hypothetical protein [Rhodococcus tibetensis]|uniref:IrrE N-terminal-like domain-containing protein n=1 Tax=Rhodococcus tibetensis TaxID=2965064 RepID=A0ABT1QEL4_9NOCA|nr:hypothetical protein [Rhodococcus sp. FXJ9.536]MCQ4120728.1 hypothetical protein [Rhodococcus sp. FXJ9.536]